MDRTKSFSRGGMASREGVDIETRPFSFPSRGKCAWVRARGRSHDRFLRTATIVPIIARARPNHDVGCVALLSSSFFFSLYVSLSVSPPVTRHCRARTAAICDFSYDVARIAARFARATTRILDPRSSPCCCRSSSLASVQSVSRVILFMS